MTTTQTRPALNPVAGCFVILPTDPAVCAGYGIADELGPQDVVLHGEQRAMVELHRLAGYRWTAAYGNDDGTWRMGFHKPTGRRYRDGAPIFEYTEVTA